MDSRHRFGLAVLLVAVSAAFSALAAPELPARIVTHWDAAGQPDDTLPRTLGLALLPGLAAVMLLVFAAIPRVDPLRANIAEFRVVYDWFVVLFTAFMAVVHGGVVAFNLGYRFPFTLLVLAAVAGLLYFVGVLLAHAERNWFVGIRTPWTLSSDRVWDRTHRLGSRLFKLTAGVSLVGLFFGEYAVYFLVVPAVLTPLVTTVYSYVLYERLEAEGDGLTSG